MVDELESDSLSCLHDDSIGILGRQRASDPNVISRFVLIGTSVPFLREAVWGGSRVSKGTLNYKGTRTE